MKVRAATMSPMSNVVPIGFTLRTLSRLRLGRPGHVKEEENDPDRDRAYRKMALETPQVVDFSGRRTWKCKKLHFILIVSKSLGIKNTSEKWPKNANVRYPALGLGTKGMMVWAPIPASARPTINKRDSTRARWYSLCDNYIYNYGSLGASQDNYRLSDWLDYILIFE